jgi:hypothetical protein
VVAVQLITERHDGAHEVVLQRGRIRRAWAGLVRDIDISDICVGSLIAECRLVVRRDGGGRVWISRLQALGGAVSRRGLLVVIMVVKVVVDIGTIAVMVLSRVMLTGSARATM